MTANISAIRQRVLRENGHTTTRAVRDDGIILEGDSAKQFIAERKQADRIAAERARMDADAQAHAERIEAGWVDRVADDMVRSDVERAIAAGSPCVAELELVVADFDRLKYAYPIQSRTTVGKLREHVRFDEWKRTRDANLVCVGGTVMTKDDAKRLTVERRELAATTATGGHGETRTLTDAMRHADAPQGDRGNYGLLSLAHRKGMDSKAVATAYFAGGTAWQSMCANILKGENRPR